MADVRIKYKVDKGELVIARTELEKINKELGITNTKGNQLSGTLKTIGGAVVAAFTIDKLVDFSKKVVEITAEFQKLRAVLTNTLGSKSAADTALKNIQDFAAKTPFSVQQLTQSFVKLANQGFVPTTEELRKLGDVAASTGKEFNMLTEAIIDAQTGEFERLKEFGIRASKEGDKVTFTFKGVQTQTEFTSKSIRDYVLSLGDLQGVSGSMAAISATLGGQISNIGDSIDSLLNNIGQGLNPEISGVIGLFGTLINTLNSFVSVPVVEKIKQEQGELNVLVGAITAANTSEEARSTLITELNQKYPDFLKNIDAEKVTNEQLALRLKDVNEQFLRKIALQEAEDRFREAQSEILDSIDKEVELRKANAASIQFLNEQRAKGAITIRNEETTLAVIQKREREIKEIQEERTDTQGKLTEQLNTYTAALDLFNTSSNDYFETTTEVVAVTDKQTEALKKLSEQYTISRVDAIRSAQEQLNALGGQSEATLDEIEKFTLEAGEKEQAYYDKSAELAAQDLKTYEETQAKKRQIDEDEFDRKVNLAFQLFDIGQMIASNQIASLQNQKAYELKLAGDDADAKARIEEEFDRKLSQIRRKQAIASKAGALLEIFMATRESVMKAVAASPLTGGLPWSAINAGIGVAQAGLVLAQPIPKFKHGVIDIKGGVQGQDSIHAMLTPHESVMTERETRNFLPTLKAIRENRVDPSLLNAISEGRSPESRVISVVNEVPRDTFMWDEGGFSHYMQRKNVTIEKKNVRYKC